ncbi:MAG: SH3 domain-containing protein [Marinoscillum sp.]
MKSALILILSSVLLEGFCQQTNRPEIFYRVIPVNGINLREQPRLNSRVIVSVPFANQVSTTEIVKYDTIIDSSNGNWIRAKYKNHSGYLFSGFIEDYNYVEGSSINSSYRLQPEGLIITELSYDPELHWYGLYHDITSDLYELKSVEVELISYKSTVGGLCANLSIENPNRSGNPGFFIGSSINLTLGLKNTSRNTLLKCLSKADECTIPFEGIDYSILLEDSENKNGLKITNGNDEQLLLSGISKSAFLSLKFAEDIDGDNKLDLILDVYNNTGDGSQGGKYYMFLSSEAKAGNLVELVSTYNWSTGGCD